MQMMHDVLSIKKPEHALPLVFDSPHSGKNYPANFDYACDFKTLQRAEDHFVDELFDHATDYGASFLKAHFPRSYIDVNRGIDEIDHLLIDGIWPDALTPSPRAQAGIGLVRRLVRPELPVYARRLSVEEVQNRIATYYTPYHDALEKLISHAHDNFGQVWHINCHSMPSKPAVKSIMARAIPARYADFVLGDRNGTTCDLSFTHDMRDFLQSLGYSVAINDPYKGVECVRAYSAPSIGRHSIQIEINKALYMDEESCEKHKGFKTLKADMEKLTAFLSEYARANLLPIAAD